jgi:Co/Zn/Cd efflux system component
VLEGTDPTEVRKCLKDLPGVAEVHDLHVWAMSTTQTALTAHLVTADEAPRAGRPDPPTRSPRIYSMITPSAYP